MNMNTVTEFSVKDYDSVCIFTDANSADSLKKAFPSLKSFIEGNAITMDSKTIFSLPIMIDDKKINLHVLGFGCELTSEIVMDAFGLMGKKFSNDKAKKVLCHMSSISTILEHEAFNIAAAKGLMAGAYSFNSFQNDKSAQEPSIVHLYTGSNCEEAFLPAGIIAGNAVSLARELVDEPANIMNPMELARRTVEHFQGKNVEVEIFSRSQIESFGMNLYLAVANGSIHEPQLIVMRYMNNPDSKEIIGLIGKGLTYDTGGYSIKPTEGMMTMKCDMGGAAAVIGAMDAICTEQQKVNVVAVIAACENRISDRSYFPGDIFRSMNGKTVEITNTDAEGRLTLADAMTYTIRNEGATKVVDICTLTGACVVALGEEYAGVVTWDDSLWKLVNEASQESLDFCWRLPLNKRLQEKNKSKVADLLNCPNRLGGMETAGLFVGEFCEDKPWIHIDIAGTAYIEDEKPAFRKGATGFGVSLLASLVKEL